MDHRAFGWTVEETCRQHPDLSPSEAHAAMLYYHDHRDEIDAEIRAEWDQSEQERPSPGSHSPFLMRLRKARGAS